METPEEADNAQSEQLIVSHFSLFHVHVLLKERLQRCGVWRTIPSLTANSPDTPMMKWLHSATRPCDPYCQKRTPPATTMHRRQQESVTATGDPACKHSGMTRWQQAAAQRSAAQRRLTRGAAGNSSACTNRSSVNASPWWSITTVALVSIKHDSSSSADSQRTKHRKNEEN